LLGRLAGDLHHELGPNLLSVAVHGSWVAGDFVEGRSGLGVLVVLAHDPDRTVLGRVALVHQRLVRDYPQWAEHIEVDYVSPAAVADALEGRRDHSMLRICPGELLHIDRVSQQYMMNWRSAVEHNQVLFGQPPGDVLPWIDDHVVREAIADNLRQWPEWSLDLRGAGGEAYAVLTVCRAAVLLRSGRFISKRAAAEELAATHPQWAELIDWARHWWYAGGLSIEPGRLRHRDQRRAGRCAARAGRRGRRGAAATLPRRPHPGRRATGTGASCGALRRRRPTRGQRPARVTRRADPRPGRGERIEPQRLTRLRLDPWKVSHTHSIVSPGVAADGCGARS
jgi:hypothetical protein